MSTGHRVWARLMARPHQTMLALVWVPIGVCAVVVGPAVSLSITRTLGLEPGLVRAWGALGALGGAYMSYGLLAGRVHAERIGCAVLGPVLALYGLCVIAGLGVGGLVTGPENLALAAGSALKSYELLRQAIAKATLAEAVRDGR